MHKVDIHALVLIFVMSLVTILLRFLPFLYFEKRKTPESIVYLGKVLPYAIMGMLIVYCLKDVSWVSGSHGLPEILAIAFVAGLHAWRKNALLSVGLGTVLYMILLQRVFP